MKTPILRLSQEEANTLEALCWEKACSVRVIRRAKILLLSHQGLKAAAIADALGVGIHTVPRIRKKYQKGGLDQALWDAERPGGPVKFSAEEESALFALVCSDPPEGKPHWSLQLIKETAEKKQIVSSISIHKIQLLLKKWGIKGRR